jgi:outer membrane protein assembly factor BamB
VSAPFAPLSILLARSITWSNGISSGKLYQTGRSACALPPPLPPLRKEALVTRLFLLIVITLALATRPVAAENWPSWRGPEQNGISHEKALPVEWGPGKNIAWELPLPGMGGSTPAIWGERIFLTCAEGQDLVLLSISTAGKVQWKRKVGTSGRATIRRDEANEASASPCTDGKHVYAFVGTGDLACFDFEGNEVWKFNVQSRYGKFSIQHGVHPTPLLFGDRLYQNLIHAGGHWVIALDKATGKEIWKVARSSDARGESKEAYSSPCLWQNGKDAYIVVLGADYATAHRLSDGGEIWRLADLNWPKYSTAFRIIASPVAVPDLIVVPTARGTVVVAVKPDATGLIRAGGAGEQWRNAKGAPDVPSPLIHDGLVYLCREDGDLNCLDAKTGAPVYANRLHTNRYRASPVVADGKIYLASRDGWFSVVKAGRGFELLAVNKLPDEFIASPAIANGRIYLRGFKSLYAIEAAK